MSCKRREFGICLALGASYGHILRRIMNQGTQLVALGLLFGIGGALYLARFLGQLLFEIEPIDPPTFVAVVLVLGGSALISLGIPAHRAARTNPVEALRQE